MRRRLAPIGDDLKPFHVDPVPILPPLDGRMELATLHERSRVQLLTRDKVDEVADYVCATNARWVWLEGFSGAGKTLFAARLAHTLGWRHVELDGLSHGGDAGTESYAYCLDSAKLDQSLGTPERRTHVVVDGVCLREVVERVGDVGDALVVYIACVEQLGDELMWHNGLTMELPVGLTHEGDWLLRAIIRYHGARQPYTDAHFIFLRIETPDAPCG